MPFRGPIRLVTDLELTNQIAILCPAIQSWKVSRGMFSTSVGEGGVQYIGGYHEYNGGISGVHWGRGMFSTSVGEGGVQYIGGYHEYNGGDIRSTLGDVQCIGGYHDSCRGVSC